MPDATIARNVMIMPMTVPIKPSNGPAATASRRNDWKRSSFGLRATPPPRCAAPRAPAFSMRLPSPRNASSTRPSGLFGLRLVEIPQLRRHCQPRDDQISALEHRQQHAENADGDDHVADDLAVFDAPNQFGRSTYSPSSAPLAGSTTARW